MGVRYVCQHPLHRRFEIEVCDFFHAHCENIRSERKEEPARFPLFSNTESGLAPNVATVLSTRLGVLHPFPRSIISTDFRRIMQPRFLSSTTPIFPASVIYIQVGLQVRSHPPSSRSCDIQIPTSHPYPSSSKPCNTQFQPHHIPSFSSRVS